MSKRTHISVCEKQLFEYRTKLCKPLITLALCALISVISLWHLVLNQLTLQHPLLLLGVVILPLLLALWANLNGSYKGAIGVCFISLFYFTAGVTHWFHPHLWPIGMSETLLSACLFTLALLYARWLALSHLPYDAA
ncbi:DUF2069 domain-containing protein [Marinomonas ostreistagni]|uniref:DUF2069 domain-containing protein n=1 Tax=Marinomonas ostreistagni TaxID=359209 RepID=UPI00195231CB|nr:DUF2069 domain-containing protein [Marinomonas ostreistagni]MBM6549731.1 DUF2069 domain-containing protein [Marinomonas ostreistagni]